MKRQTIGVLADDLTGAMDAGMQSLRFGLKTAVTAFGVPEGEVLVYDTESRGRVDAAQRVRDAAAALRKAGVPLVYKKIDSTLRGGVGAELEALLSAGFCQKVLLAPALPALGRTTQGSVHLVDGVPVAQTELAKDPFAPVRCSDLLGILAQGCPRRTALLPLSTVRAGVGPVRSALDALYGQGVSVVAADAVADENLRVLALAAPPDALLCGSAGLFAFLPLRFGLTARASAQPVYAQQRPTLLVNGSPAARSKQQIAFLQSRGAPVWDGFGEQDGPVPAALNRRAAVILRADAGGPYTEAALRRLTDRASDLLGRGVDVAVDLAGDGKENIARRYAGDPAGLSAARQAVQNAAARVAKACSGRFGALAVFGGDTALTVCAALGARGIGLCGQVQPLVPVGVLQGGVCDGAYMVTKAGGFGSEETLEAIFSLFDPHGKEGQA